jgi:bifunctional DNA-binding transcriptional regulator/antitoxin component of YhaV-PrlF toxin-antitoxin module
LDASGRLSIPKSYRQALTVTPDTDLAVLRVGDALVIAPCDAAFAAVTRQLEARMTEAGSDVEELVAAAAIAREEIVREEFGDVTDE